MLSSTCRTQHVVSLPLKCSAARRIVSGPGVTLCAQPPPLSRRRLKSTRAIAHVYKFEYVRWEILEENDYTVGIFGKRNPAACSSNNPSSLTFSKSFAHVPNPNIKMAEILLDISLIREAVGHGPTKVKGFIEYLNKLREEHAEIAICQSLLEAVEREYISPRSLSPFIGWCKSLDVTVLCLNYPHSCTVRKLAIKNLGKAISNPQKWERMWECIGGTQGLIDHLAKISVIEVKAFAKVIGNGQGRRIPKREKAIEELLRALLPSHYPGSVIQSHDKRPIQELYGKLVTACSAEFVTELLDEQDNSNPLYRNMRPFRLLKTHRALLKERVVDAISNGGKQDLNFAEYLKAFCYTLATEPGPNKWLSAPMVFSMGALKMRLDNSRTTSWPRQVSESEVYMTLVRKCIKRKLPEEKLRLVFVLGLRLLEANPKFKSAFQSSVIWHELSTRWGKSPADYEDLLTKAMRLDLGGSSTAICQTVLSLSKKLELKPDRLWDLLRLYYLHTPKKSSEVVDLNTSTDLTPLGKQQWWSAELFYTLEKEKAIRLLRLLQVAFPGASYLQPLPGTSILGSGGSTGGAANPVLLSTMLQRDSPEIQKRITATVDELRKKSSTSREQVDRAEHALAASRHAIASGSLELYGETVTWMQRYVREQPILQQIYGKGAVLTMEGIELLSGIPDPLPDNMALEEVATRVDKANEILLKFHETMLIAKREPSYNQYDWSSVSELFGLAIKKRVEHARALQKRLLSSDADMYAAIWEKTLAMLEIVNYQFLSQAQWPIQNLLETLPPTTLVGIAKAMLASGAERRKKKDRELSDDSLESLSYKVLLLIVKSDKPELAQQLVLGTILDRPDASSWHRQFLSERFMRSLTAKQAQEMLLAFATAIGEKLEEQSYVKVGEKPAPASAPPQSIVKVTTIKYLAQLLDNATFISVDAAVEVLVEIFKASTHRDIRLATLNSLLSLLNTLCGGADEKWRSNPLVERIMKALETVIPVIGSINERRPPQEAEWKEAQTTGILPDISDKASGFPPLMEELLGAPHGFKYPGIKSNLRAEFVSRFFLPIYKLSKEEQHRWTTLFLAKHKSTLKATDLPRVPVIPDLYKLVNRFPYLIPQTILDDYNTYMLLCLSPPATLQSLNASIKRNLDLCYTAEGKHWLSLFDRKTTNYPSSGTHTLTNMIYTTHLQSSLPNSTGITHKKVQEILLSHASLLLDLYAQDDSKHATFWDAFVRSLRQPCKSTSHHETNENIRKQALVWRETCRPLLQSITDLLNARRAKAGNYNNPQQSGKSQAKRIRTTPSLPSPTLLNLWLLPFPSFPKPKDLRTECEILVQGLEAQITELLAGERNVLRWVRVASDIKETVKEALNTDEEKLLVASLLGRLVAVEDESMSKQGILGLNLVKMTVAMGLLESGRGGVEGTANANAANAKEHSKAQSELRGQLREVMTSWLEDENEDLSEVAREWVVGNKGLWAKITRAEDVVGEVGAAAGSKVK